MPIVNSTCYNSDDLSALIDACICQARAWKRPRAPQSPLGPFDCEGALVRIVQRGPPRPRHTGVRLAGSVGPGGREVVIYLNDPRYLWSGAELLLRLMEGRVCGELQQGLLWTICAAENAIPTRPGRIGHSALLVTDDELAAMAPEIIQMPLRFDISVYEEPKQQE